jgi:hypothetical protein
LFTSVLLPALLCLSTTSAFAQTSCPLPGQKPMQVVHLFFGRAIPGRAPLTNREWSRFASEVLTPNFPDGFTAYDADGQWMNDKLHRIVRERSKVVIIAADPGVDIVQRLNAVTDAYRSQFHQLSVGVISETACAAF